METSRQHFSEFKVKSVNFSNTRVYKRETNTGAPALTMAFTALSIDSSSTPSRQRYTVTVYDYYDEHPSSGSSTNLGSMMGYVPYLWVGFRDNRVSPIHMMSQLPDNGAVPCGRAYVPLRSVAY